MAELEDKLKQVKKDVRDVFSQGELNEDSYMNIVFQTCNKSGVFQGLVNNENIKKTLIVATSLEKQLSLGKKKGIIMDYLCMKGVPISFNAKDDMGSYNNLEENIRKYLKDNLKKPVFREDLDKAVEKKVINYASSLDMMRRAHLITYFQIVFEREMKAVKKQDYELKRLQKALENI